MTTPTAAALYEAEHVHEMSGKGFAVFNPKSQPLNELPTIYGFNNGGSPGWFHAVLIAEDGTTLGGHVCSSQAYMLHDLGILEGTRPDRHDTFKEHYPNGYRMDFVGSEEVKNHAGLLAAIELHKAKKEAA